MHFLCFMTNAAKMQSRRKAKTFKILQINVSFVYLLDLLDVYHNFLTLSRSTNHSRNETIACRSWWLWNKNANRKRIFRRSSCKLWNNWILTTIFLIISIHSWLPTNHPTMLTPWRSSTKRRSATAKCVKNATSWCWEERASGSRDSNTPFKTARIFIL